MTPLSPLIARGHQLAEVLRRHPGSVAVFGFVSGLASFFLIERHRGSVRVIALLLLASWVWLVLERLLRTRLKRRFGIALPQVLLNYAMQLIHQESLFFTLPFFIVSTAWNTTQAAFTALLVIAALIAITDPLYYHRLAPRRWLYLAYHSLTLFAVLLVALPLIVHLPTARSYSIALVSAALLSFPSLAATVPRQLPRRGLAVAALLTLLATCGWFARSAVPPATLWLGRGAISLELDQASREPGPAVRRLSVAQLRDKGVYAFTAINAPLGLSEQVFHHWIHNGTIVDSIDLEILGGRKAGYRAWTHKTHFPDTPAGRWEVRVVTAGGQLIGTLRFRVTDEAAPTKR